MEVSSQHHVPAPLFPTKNPSASIEWETWWAGEPAWTFMGVKNVLPLSEPRHYSSSIFQPGAYSLYRNTITAATSCMLLCVNDLIFCPKNLPWIFPLDTVFRFTVRQYVMPHVLAMGNLGFLKILRL